MDAVEIFEEMGRSFEKKIDEDFECSIQFNISDTDDNILIKIGNGEVRITSGIDEGVDMIIDTTTETIQDIYDRKITAFAAAGKADPSEPAPLDWTIGGGFRPAKMKNIYYTLMHFFHPEEPEKIKLGEEYSRMVHGGLAIPLYYHPGFRSAWYMIKKGEKLNEPGDTDPFPQGIVVIDGEGYAKIGDKTVEIKKNESYYIPPNSDQVLWTDSDEPLVIIWLAWGEGA